MADFDDFDDDFGSEFGSSGFGSSFDVPAPEPLVEAPAASLAPAASASASASAPAAAADPAPGGLQGRSEIVDTGSVNSDGEASSWPYVRHRGLFTVPVTPENAFKCGWLLEEVAAGMWRRRWCMLQGPRGYLSLHDSDESGTEATVVIPTSLCRIRKVKVKGLAAIEGAAAADEPIPEGQPPEKKAVAEPEPAPDPDLDALPDPEPEPVADGEPEPEPEPETLADKLPPGLKEQAAALEAKYDVSAKMEMLQSLAGAKLDEVEKKHKLSDQRAKLSAIVAMQKTAGMGKFAELDQKHGLTDMAQVAKTKAMEAAASAGYAEGQDDDGSDSHSDSGSSEGQWGGDDPLKHRWALRIDIPDKTLPMVVGARASVFTLDPSTETGQTAWLEAILGTAEAGVAGASVDKAAYKPDDSLSWLPANRAARTEEEAAARGGPLIDIDLDFSRERMENIVAKKTAQSVAKRLSRPRTTALDEMVSAGKAKTGKLSSSASSASESGGLVSKLKDGAKDLKDSATSSSSSSAAKGAEDAARSSSKSASSSAAKDTGDSAAEAKGGGGVRDAALLGALVGGATSAVSGYHDSRTEAAELVRVADVVSSMSIGHLHRIVCDKTGRSLMQSTSHEDCVKQAMEACELNVDAITATTRLAIGKAAVFGAASGGVPAAAAAAASKQVLMRGLGAKSAGAAGSIAMAAFDISKDASKVYGGEMDKEVFKKKAGGHVATSAAGAAGALQGASMGAVAGPAGSFVGAMLGGIGGSIVAAKGYETAVTEDSEAAAAEAAAAEKTPEEISAAAAAEREAKRTDIAAEFKDSELVDFTETANGEPLRTLLKYMSTDELWRYLSDRSLFTRMGDEVLHATELREAAMELLRPDGCLCLDEKEITAFPRAQLCRLLLDAGSCSRDAVSKMGDDELRIKVFDAYGPAPVYMDPNGGSFAGKISPSGASVSVHQVATAGKELCEPVPPEGISAKIKWLGQGADSEIEDCIAICPRTASLSFPQMLVTIAEHRPAAIVIVDSGRGSQGELSRMMQAPVPIPCSKISAESAVEIRAILETSSTEDVRTVVRPAGPLYVSKTKVADAADALPDPPSAATDDPDVDALPDPDAEAEPEPVTYEWAKFAQVAAHPTLAVDEYALQTPKDLSEEASEMATAAMAEAKLRGAVLAKGFLSKRAAAAAAKKAAAGDGEAAAPAPAPAPDVPVASSADVDSILHPPPPFSSASALVTLPKTADPTNPRIKIGGAVPAEQDPAIAGSVLLIGPEDIEVGATPWHVLYCALKAGATGVIWAAKPDGLLEPLRPMVLDVPCVSISEATGKQLEQMVAKETEADDMFAPIPTGGDGDAMTEPATLTAGLGLWINDSVRFESVAVGQDHCLALTNLGSVFAWGTATKGRLGLGSEVVEPQQHPTLVAGALVGQSVSVVAAGHHFSYAVSRPGTLYAWGCNDSPGYLGVGDGIDRWEPCEVTALREHPITLLAVQHTTTVAVTNDGAKVFCWGTLEVCGKGVIRLAERTTPVEMEIEGGLVGGEKISSAGAGRKHGTMASDKGRVWTWGHGRSGRLGLGKEKADQKLKAHPTLIPAEHFNGQVVTQVYTQDDFTFATPAGGDAVFAWGCNDYPGKLGLGDTKDRFEPTGVKADPALPPVLFFSGKLAVTLDGTVYHFSKDVKPFSVVPEGMTAAHVRSITTSALICRGLLLLNLLVF